MGWGTFIVGRALRSRRKPVTKKDIETAEFLNKQLNKLIKPTVDKIDEFNERHAETSKIDSSFLGLNYNRFVYSYNFEFIRFIVV